VTRVLEAITMPEWTERHGDGGPAEFDRALDFKRT